VTAAAHGHLEPLLVGESDGRDDVRGILALHDEGRALVDHRVEDGACGVVAAVCIHRIVPAEHDAPAQVVVQ